MLLGVLYYGIGETFLIVMHEESKYGIEDGLVDSEYHRVWRGKMRINCSKKITSWLKIDSLSLFESFFESPFQFALAHDVWSVAVCAEAFAKR